MLATPKVLNSAILVVLCAVVLILALGVYRKMELETSAQAYAVSISQTILTEGPDVLLANATSELLQIRTPEALTNFFVIISRTLGDPQSIESVSGRSNVPLLIFSSESPTANYALNVAFERGMASVDITLVQRQDVWQISQFDLVSQNLAD